MPISFGNPRAFGGSTSLTTLSLSKGGICRLFPKHHWSFLLGPVETCLGYELRQRMVSLITFRRRLGFVHAYNRKPKCRIYHNFPQLPQQGHNSQLNVVLQ